MSTARSRVVRKDSAVVNYENKEVGPEQVQAFRQVLESVWLETLARPGGIREWNQNLMAVTEGRRTIKNPDGSMRVFYSWCGDWVTYHLERAGCRHAPALNRESLNGKWVPGMNLTFLRAWAGEPAFAQRSELTARFRDDPSSGFGPSRSVSFHAWDNQTDVCKDGYAPALGDLVITPRKNGDHIEFFVKRTGSILVVCAGAQLGGTALIRERSVDTNELSGIIDISGLASAEPF
jgi:hypothetical protein